MSAGVRGSPCCALCGGRKNIEHHHIGGRNHLACVTVPLCRAHHRQCHLLLEAAGVDLEYTPNRLERLIRASKAINIFQCMLHEAMHQNYHAAS
jgi:hypothetical protein